MTDKSKNIAVQRTVPLMLLWWMPALVPLVLILSALITGPWTWGLMDDLGMAGIPGSVPERFAGLYHGLVAQGRFYPVNILHLALFYKLFQNNPHAFFFFRFFEVTFAVAVWGYVAQLVTGKRAAMPLVLAVTFSFYRFYDAFFFLSTHEILGVLFSGLGCLCFMKGIDPEFGHKKYIKWPLIALGSACFFLAFMSKEPFVGVGLAMGVSLGCVWLRCRHLRPIAWIAMALVFVSVCYALILKLFVMKGYSAEYSLEWSKISANFAHWFRYVLIDHGFWLVMALYVWLSASKRTRPSLKVLWCGCFGAFAYLFYLLFILPWSGGGHYVTPLGVFFALAVTVIMLPRLENKGSRLILVLIVLSAGVNLHVAGKAVHFHSTYQQDTASLARWMAENAIFRHEVMEKGAAVRCNANEPCSTIPHLANYLHGTSYPAFTFTPKVRDILQDRNTKYYIWSPTWGDQDLRRLNNMWTTMFVSDHWYVFRRMI